MSDIKMRYDPCVGCGYCCLRLVCHAQFEDEQGRCTQLKWSEKDQRYWCLLGQVDSKFHKKMHMDEGCSSNLNTWRKEVKNRG